MYEVVGSYLNPHSFVNAIHRAKLLKKNRNCIYSTKILKKKIFIHY